MHRTGGVCTFTAAAATTNGVPSNGKQKKREDPESEAGSGGEGQQEMPLTTGASVVGANMTLLEYYAG